MKVKMDLKKWKLVVTGLIVITFLITCFLEIRDYMVEKKADVSYGEDYMDGREEKWTLKDHEQKDLAVIHVTEGLVLSGQSFGSCSIVMKDSNLIAGRVNVYSGMDLQQVVEELSVDVNNTRVDQLSPKGKSYTRLRVTDKEYLLISNAKNTVVIRVLDKNIKKANKPLHDTEEQMVDMITIK